MNEKILKEWFNVYYSQNREDLILRAFFPDVKRGFYVDVGAHDPKFFSVTKLFYDAGWRGINIEPQSFFHQKLLKERPKDINLNVALSMKSGEALFREYRDATGLSTLSEDVKDSYSDNKRLKGVTRKYKEYKVTIQTLESVLDKYAAHTPIHFLKIDVEGFEQEVINGNNWKKYRPQVLCIESNHVIEVWHDTLIKVGYKKFFFDGLNTYYIADEVYTDIIAKFDFAGTVLDKIPLNNVPLELVGKELKKQQKELLKLNEIIAKQHNEIGRLTQHIDAIEAKIINLKPVKKFIRKKR